MQKVKKAIYNRDGSLKNNAVSVISNMAGKGKENLLANMEKIIPGIGKDLDVLKAIEDIDKAKGQKVGTYLRGAAGGFALSGGNPLAAMLSAIGTSPQVAVPVLRGVSKTKTASKEALSGMLKKLKISK
jgi:hypothetical protein